MTPQEEALLAMLLSVASLALSIFAFVYALNH